MLYTLRYEDELRDSKSALSDIKETSVDTDELSLAEQLIDGKTLRFDLSAYKDDYEAAVKKVVEVKRKGKSLPEPKRNRENQSCEHYEPSARQLVGG